MRLALFALFTLACCSAQAAEMYKWTDDKGRVHYSDKPPAKGVESEKREFAEQPDAATPAPAAKKEESLECQLSRKNLKTLQDNPKVQMDLDGDGTAETIEGDAHAAQVTRAERQIAVACSAPAG